MVQAQGANFDLAAAVARVRQADAQVRIVGAALVPAIDGGAQVQHQQQPAAPASGGRGGTVQSPARTSYGTTLNASWELDFWGKNAANRDSAQAAAAASRFDRETVALTVTSGVATSYFNILGAQDRLTVARADVANAESVLAAIRDRQRFGTATELDVAQQESVAAGLRAQVPPLEQQVRQNLNALALLVGALPETLAEQSATLGDLTVPAVTPGLPSALLARRPDVQFAEAQLIGNNADITAARAALFPSVTLTGQLGIESVALGTLLSGSSVLYSLAAGLTQPIFHGEALEGAIEQKLARYEELVQAYRKAVLSAFTDVENALVAVRKSREGEAAQRQAVATAKRANDISLAQYNAGLVDITTLLNTQKTLFQAEDALVQARLGHLQAAVSLFKALGGGWQAAAAG
jgi:NodT family efflux transporter outer membrane factor (OMF) lipoprotein